MQALTSVEITVSSTASAEEAVGIYVTSRASEDVQTFDLDPNDPTSYEFSANMQSASQTLELIRNDPNFCLHSDSSSNRTICTWRVGVYAKSAFAALDEDGASWPFTIMAKTDSSFMTLQDGVPVEGSIETKSTMAYYEFFISDAWASDASDGSDTGADAGDAGDSIYTAWTDMVLEIDISPYFGDPDVYVIYDPERHGTVAKDNYDWKANTYGTDTLVIDFSEAASQALIEPQNGTTDTSGLFQIGVYAYGQSTDFELTAYVREVDPNQAPSLYETDPRITWLRELSSQFGYLDYQQIGFFAFDVESALFSADDNLDITLEVRSGSVQVYVCRDNLPDSEANARWMTQDSVGSALPRNFRFNSTLLNAMDRIYFVIEAKRKSCLFDITVSYSDNLVRLTTGETEMDTVRPGGVVYYFFSFEPDGTDRFGQDLSCTIESLTDGASAPFMYVSKTLTHPNPQNDTKCESMREMLTASKNCYIALDDHSDDRLRIMSVESNGTRDLDLLGGYYYIAVTPDTLDVLGEAGRDEVHYNLLCMSEETEITGGETISATLTDHGLKYYIYDVYYDYDADIEIVFTLLSGDVTLFISNSELSPRTTDVPHYKFITYDDVEAPEWSVASASNRSKEYAFVLRGSSAVTIAESNKYSKFYNHSCSYYIIAYAAEDSVYDLTVYLSNEIVEIDSDGTPTMGLIRSGSYRYYLTVLTEISDLKILITATDYNGNEDVLRLFVAYEGEDAKHHRPNATLNDYESSKGWINIPNAEPGIYYIAVFADTSDTSGTSDGSKDNSEKSEDEQNHYFSLLATTSRIVLSENLQYDVTESFKVWRDEGVYFAFDFASSSDFDQTSARVLELYIQGKGKTGQDDKYNVAVTNSQLHPTCGDVSNCPQVADISGSGSNSTCGGSSGAYACSIWTARSWRDPIYIDWTDNVFCNASSTLCTYYFTIWYDGDNAENAANAYNESDANTVQIKMTSTDQSVGLVKFDDTGDSFVLGTFTSNETEYEFYKAYISEDVLAELNDSVEITCSACVGRVNLYASFSVYFPDAKSKHHDGSATGGGKDVAVLQLEDLQQKIGATSDESLHIAVQNDEREQTTQYELRLSYPVQEFEPIPGELSVSSQTTAGDVTVTWDAAKIRSGVDASAATVSLQGYYLVWNKKDTEVPVNLNTPCGMYTLLVSDECRKLSSTEKNGCFYYMNVNGTDASALKARTSHVVGGLQEGAEYEFNVMVVSYVTFNNAKGEEKTVFMYTSYGTVGQPVYSSHTVSEKTVLYGLIIAVPLGLICFCVAVFCWCRKCKYQKKVRSLEERKIEIPKAKKKSYVPILAKDGTPGGADGDSEGDTDSDTSESLGNNVMLNGDDEVQMGYAKVPL